MPQFRAFLVCITPCDPLIIYITYIMTTAIELQKPLSLGHVQASVVATLAHRVFENISKQYRLGLVSTGTLSHDLNRF